LIAEFFSPLRGDATQWQRGLATCVKSASGDATQWQRGLATCVKSALGDATQWQRGFSVIRNSNFIIFVLQKQNHEEF